MSRKDLYDKAIENSAVSWCQLYREEKANREAIEAKYNALVQEIKLKLLISKWKEKYNG